MSKSLAAQKHHVYPAVVKDVHDPMRSGRIRVECPAVFGVGEDNWSPWCQPGHAAHLWSIPYEGEYVWIALRQGDPRYPMWLGQLTPFGKGPDEFRALAEGPYKDATRDPVDHTSAHDLADHAKGHDHAAGEYWNPYWHGLIFPMGAGLWANEEPGEQGFGVRDRIGQYLKMEGDPIAPVDPHDETRVGGEYDAPDLDDGTTLYSETGLKARVRLQGRHTQYLEMRLFDEDGEEEMSLVSANISDSDGNKLVFSNSLKGRNFLLERYIPGIRQSHEGYADPEDLSNSWQEVRDSEGQVWRIHTDVLTPNKWFHLTNALGDIFRVEHEGRQMFWRDHNGQQTYYDTDESGGQRHIKVEDGAGEMLRIDLDLQKVTLTDRLGNVLVLDVAADTVTLSHHVGESIVLSPGGVAVTTIAGMTVNGRLVTLNGDPVATPAGPGVAQGVGK